MLAPSPVQDSSSSGRLPVLRPGGAHHQLVEWSESRNIAMGLDAQLLSHIGNTVVTEWRVDVTSRADWKTKTEEAMKLAMQVVQRKQYPWPGASNVIYPLITSAAIQFAARAYPAIINNRNVVKGLVIGKDIGTPSMGPLGPKIDPQGQVLEWQVKPGEKTARAKNIGDHMSWQLLEEQTEWEPQTDQLLHILPIVGCCFRKTYFDPAMGRNRSLLVSAMNLVVNYYAKSIETATRLTEEIKLYPNEIREMELSQLFIEQKYGPANPRPGEDASGVGQDQDAPHTFLEQHRWLDLDQDGYREPYIVTVHLDTQKVARIVARYDREGIMVRSDGKIGKIEPIHYYTQYNFLPNPEGGIYGVGLGQLLRPLNESVNTTLNMLIDAGHLSITSGGFVGRSLSMSSGTMRFSPGEFKVVNASGQNVRESVVQLQFPGPSDVLFKLLVLLIDAGREIASVKDVLLGDQNQPNTAATTTLALIDQGLKVFTGIYKRIYNSLKNEFNKQFALNRKYMDEWAEYNVGDEWLRIQREDYEKGSGVAPISDPSMVSDAQRAARVNLLLAFKDDPRLDGTEIYRRAFDVANIEQIDKLFSRGVPPDPTFVLGMRDLDIKQKRNTAAQVLDLARAVHALSRADFENGDAVRKVLEQRIDVLQREQEMMANGGQQGQPGGGQPGAAAPGGLGGGGAGVQPVEAAPGNAGAPQVP